MRRSALVGAVLLLVGCAGGAPESPPTPDVAPSSGAPSVASSAPATPDATPVETPSVEGNWRTLDATSMLTDEEIDVVDVPASLKTSLKESVLDVVTANEGEEGADDCPVETSVVAYHPAGFAVVSIVGCGPEESTGVVAQEGDGWVPAVLTAPDVPACQELADAGVPARVPYLNGENLRCDDTDGSVRFW